MPISPLITPQFTPTPSPFITTPPPPPPLPTHSTPASILVSPSFPSPMFSPPPISPIPPPMPTTSPPTMPATAPPVLHMSSEIPKIGRAVQQECRDRSRMPSSA
eukprot:TRINITY_DN2682_c0_g1_i2.p1 TRINITY_DN2682_c0_g1~~TRINITY_DN2682_c0_g1_i2.p1  ORF type:complete len:104 (+),score=10.61 TRINITY_DN2682_c0_g1_i2:173-484(+)